MGHTRGAREFCGGHSCGVNAYALAQSFTSARPDRLRAVFDVGTGLVELAAAASQQRGNPAGPPKTETLTKM